LYMELPQCYRPSGFEHQDIVLRLKKSIYGQVDSPKLFYEHLSCGMSKLGFKPSEADPCLLQTLRFENYESVSCVALLLCDYGRRTDVGLSLQRY